jgi:hypothetical protein
MLFWKFLNECSQSAKLLLGLPILLKIQKFKKISCFIYRTLKNGFEWKAFRLEPQNSLYIHGLNHFS